MANRVRIVENINKPSGRVLVTAVGYKVQVVAPGTTTPVTVYQAATGGATWSWFGTDPNQATGTGDVVPFTADPATTGVPVAGGEMWVDEQRLELRVLTLAGVEVLRRPLELVSATTLKSVEIGAGKAPKTKAVSLDDYWSSAIYATKKAALEAAIAATTITPNVNGATIVAAQDVYSGLDGPVEFPAWVNLVGQGKRSTTRFVCSTADASLRFRSRGGFTGDFTIDAANIATEPFWTDGVKRTFRDIDVRSSAGDAFVFENAQNNVSTGLMGDRMAGTLYRMKNGASSNHFFGCDGEAWDRYAIEQDQTLAQGATIPNTGGSTVLSPNPNYNYFHGGVMERAGKAVAGTALGGIYCGGGSLILDDTLIASTWNADTALVIAELAGGVASYSRIMLVGNAKLIGNDTTNSVAIETRNSGGTFVITGRADLQGHKYAYRLADSSSVEIHGQVVYNNVTTRFANYGAGTQTYNRLVRTTRSEPFTISRPSAADDVLVWKLDADTGYRGAITDAGIYLMDGVSATPTNFPRIVSFTGNPEGVVSARIGTIGLRIDATSASTAVYTKASGTGTTGWVQGDPTSLQTVATDANGAVINGGAEVTFHTATLTAIRTFTLNAVTAAGQRRRVVRTGGGAFTLDVWNAAVGLLKSLSTNQWADFLWDGTNWKLTAFGSL